MARRSLVALAATGGLALTLLPATAASADSAFDQVLKDYQADGKIDQCAHSGKTLSAAEHQIPNDIQQYAPDFPAALSAALRQRAAGTCDKGGMGSTTTTTSASGSGSSGSGSSGSASSSSSSSSSSGGKAPTPAKPHSGATPAPAPVATPAGGTLAASVPANATASEAGTPLPIILLAILGGILLLVGLLVLLGRFLGWSTERWQPEWHTWREAGYRTQGTLSDFADWVRGGR